MSGTSTAIRVLHLSDLHAGMAEHRDRFQHVRGPILDDLREQVGTAPVHLLLFTGDLTQRGVEFDVFQRELNGIVEALELWTRHRPVVLPVPGNHDLERPDASDGILAPLLDAWDSNETLRAKFWSDERHGLRKTVDMAFAKYNAWWGAHYKALGPSAKVQQGAMPGDFSASVEVGGARVGIVGLNSAFLQLTDDRKAGDLDLDVVQLNRAVPGDVDPWLARHDLTLLMTHHPPSWLSVRARETLGGWIARAGRFDAHLFGHMHTPEMKQVDAQGLKRSAEIQAPSLFGVEQLRDKGVERSVGYSLLSFDTGRRMWRLTPRAATAVGGELHMNPDTRFKLRESRWVEFESQRPWSAAEVARADGVAETTLCGDMELPGGPYNERLYISRPAIEDKALKMLGSVGRPAVLCGSHGTGKTWMLAHVLGRWKNERAGARIVYVPFGEFDGEALASIDHFVWRFAGVVADQLSVGEDLVDRLDPKRPQPLMAMMRLRKFFQEAALKPPEPLVLALDDADRLRAHTYRQDFYAGLRAWMDRATGTPLERLRLLFAIAVPPAKLIEGDGKRSIFNLTVPLDLTAFGEEQVRDLARRCALSLSAREEQDVLTRSGGAPAEIVRVLYDLRTRRVTAASKR